ncbi:C1 family peptidase [soil metagenome]
MSLHPVADIDLRHRLGKARDQGSRPTCLAFSISDLHAALRSGWTPLSCETAFYHAQRRAKRPPSVGATLQDMLAAVAIDGQPAETDWPYLATTPTDVADWKPPASLGEAFTRSGASPPLSWPALMALLNANRPVTLLLMLSDSFYVPDGQGVVRAANDEHADPSRRHAVLAVGHGVIEGETALLIRNSWGEAWGAAGHAWLPLSFVAPRLFGLALLDEDEDVPSYSDAA